jgi:hypothetical protein
MNQLTRDEFVRRWADVQDNLRVITENNKIGAPDLRKDDTWMVRFAELLAESQFRGGIPSNKVALETILENISLSQFSHPSKSKTSLPYYFKFGKKEHLQQMLKNNEIRMANSSLYSKQGLNHGQKDEENSFTFSIIPELLRNVDGQTGLADIDPINKNTIFNITHQTRQNYMMWCAAHKYDYRIPYAFEAEAVLIIKEPRRFKKEIIRSLRKMGLNAQMGKVRYFDPYLDLESKLDVRFSKHFRFQYQNEVRVVAQGKNLPETVFIEVPELSTYCEIHDLA